MKKYYIPTIIFENEHFSSSVKMELNAAFFLHFNNDINFNVLVTLLKIRGCASLNHSLQQTTFRVANILPHLPKTEPNKLECLFIYSYLCYLTFKYKSSPTVIDIQYLTNLLDTNEEAITLSINTLIECNSIIRGLEENNYIVNFIHHISR